MKHNSNKMILIISKVVETDSAIMHHPGEDNVPLMRTHQELVRYSDAEDDTFNTVVETLAEKLSHILEEPAVDDGETSTSEQSTNGYQRLLGPPGSSIELPWEESSEAQPDHSYPSSRN